MLSCTLTLHMNTQKDRWSDLVCLTALSAIIWSLKDHLLKVGIWKSSKNFYLVTKKKKNKYIRTSSLGQLLANG